jgi:putative hydrolase of the HAD superfamily
LAVKRRLIFIFDIGNVVIRWPGNDPIFNYISKKYHVPKAKMKEAMWNGLGDVESGKLSVDNYVRESLARVGRKLHKDDDAKSLISYPFEKRVKLNLSVIRLVKSLRKMGYQLYALSNTSPPHVKVMRRMGLMTLFDRFFVSCELGLLKPDVKIYKRVLNKIHGTPRDVIYIDDILANVEGARQAGMKRAIHYKDAKSLKAEISKIIQM